MKRLAQFVVIALCALTPSAVVVAQPPAFALGQPLPDGSLATGTVSVRVIAGSPNANVNGAEVTLVVNGTPRSARTNADGRAVFSGLTVGASVQAHVKDADGKDVASSTFSVVGSGGQRLMLSTKPFGGAMQPAGGHGAGGPGGPAGAPSAKQMSGQVRQDENTRAGTLVVRLTYDNLTIGAKGSTDSNPPVGESVMVVGYNADDSVTVSRIKTNSEGYAEFANLDMTGGTAYFPMATLPRGTGRDRMFAMPVQPDGKAGFRLVLSGEKRDSAEPNLDALVSQRTTRTPAGWVRVSLDGVPAAETPIRLIDADSHQPVASGVAKVLDLDPSTLDSGSKFTQAASAPANQLEVYVHGGTSGDAALADIPLWIVSDGATGQLGEPIKTGGDGKAKLTTKLSGKLRAMFRVAGKELSSEPFELATSGGNLDIRAQWLTDPRPQVLLEVPHVADRVLYAEAISQPGSRLPGTFRSMPFITVPQTGTHAQVVVYPRIMMKFNMRATVEDQLFAVQGRWQIDNNSWIPFRATADGLVIPLPKSHRSAVIAEMNQEDVSVAQGEGLRVLRPLPSGSGIAFVAGFSMPVDNDGSVSWALDLPLGTFGSDLHIRYMDGLAVDLPPSNHGQVKPGRDGQPYFMVEQIAIPPGRSMTMTVRGLPTLPAWRTRVPMVLGILVVVMMVTGVGLALFWRRSPTVDTAARRTALLDELVEIEKRGGDRKRKEQIMSELEKIWA